MRRTLVAVVVLLVAGCTAAPRPAATPAGPPAERLMLTALDRGDMDLAGAFAYWADRNARTAACLKPSGYTYLPFVSRAWIDSRRALGLSRAAFTERYGYGTTTLIDYVPPGTVVVDPNQVALAKLAPDRQKTIATRLNACIRTVVAAVGPPPYAAEQDLDAVQSARSNQILARAAADPRVVTAQQKRTACIRATGYDVGDQRTLPYANAADAARDRYEKAAWDRALAGRESNRLRLAEVLSPAQLTALETLQHREIVEARQVQPCQFGYDDTYRAVYREVLNDAIAGRF